MMRVVVGNVPQKRSAAESLEWEALSIEEILALVTTDSLLGGAHTYGLSGALSGERAAEFLDIAKELVASPHQFVFAEEKLLKKTTDRLAKLGAAVHRGAEPPKEKEAFNVFSLTHALAARDRKKLWLLYTEALRQGVVPEAIAGILHWKARDLLAKPTAGYSRQELTEISRELATLYHEAHRGAGDLALLLERFVLLL